MDIRAISLFSGAGGLDLAARWAGIRTVAYVEYEPYAQGVLISRMRSGELDPAPLWDDVRSFDGKPWHGRVDIVFGGFPCQDVSRAGKKVGIVEGKRSGLWKEFARIVGEVGPRFVLVENVSGLLMGGGIGVVLADLAELGFDVRWGMHGACAVGAPHSRERLFLLADSFSDKRVWNCMGHSPTPEGWNPDPQKRCENWNRFEMYTVPPLASEWGPEIQGCPEPPLLRMANGMAPRLDRARLTGNGVVPAQPFPIFQEIVKASKQVTASPAAVQAGVAAPKPVEQEEKP